MARPPRTIASYGRPKPRFKPQPRVLVICEDSKSCVTYLREAAHHYRAYLQVEITHCGRTDPQGIVAEAIRRSTAYEHVYCAIDRDDHPKFSDAEQLAKENKVKVTVKASFPCYEFWLLLHFRKVRRPYSKTAKLSAGDFVVRDLCAEKGMEDYAKGASQGLFLRLLPQLPDAKKLAAEVLTEAAADGNPNPSTTLHELLYEFEKLGVPLPVA